MLNNITIHNCAEDIIKRYPSLLQRVEIDGDNLNVLSFDKTMKVFEWKTHTNESLVRAVTEFVLKVLKGEEIEKEG